MSQLRRPHLFSYITPRIRIHVIYNNPLFWHGFSCFYCDGEQFIVITLFNLICVFEKTIFFSKLSAIEATALFYWEINTCDVINMLRDCGFRPRNVLHSWAFSYFIFLCGMEGKHCVFESAFESIKITASIRCLSSAVTDSA